jgi:hypothetical protein
VLENCLNKSLNLSQATSNPQNTIKSSGVVRGFCIFQTLGLAVSCGIAAISIRLNYKRLLRRLNACLPVKFVDYYRKWCPVEFLSNAWLSRWRRAWEKEFFEDEEVSKSK